MYDDIGKEEIVRNIYIEREGGRERRKRKPLRHASLIILPS
jgi:hypothetical protein